MRNGIREKGAGFDWSHKNRSRFESWRMLDAYSNALKCFVKTQELTAALSFRGRNGIEKGRVHIELFMKFKIQN